MTQKTQLTFAPSGEAGVTVEKTVNTRFGEKAILGGDTYEAREAIKSLEWDETHRTFDDNRKAWTVDADALDELEAALDDHGFKLVTRDWLDDMTDAIRDALGDDADARRMVPLGIEVEVDYLAKKSEKPMSKSGIVTGIDDDALYFRRDDGRSNRVMADGIYSMGHYPYMGEITEVRVDIPAEASA